VPWNKILNFIMHQRTAVASIAAAVLFALATGIKQGHVDWPAVGYAALTALAGVARSAVGK